MEFFKVLSLIIGVLPLFLNLAKCTDDVLNGGQSNNEIGIDNVTSTFLNFGRKANGDRRYCYENPSDVDRMLKSKTDILSHLLRMHIDRLRNETNQVDPKNIYLYLSLSFFP